MRSRKIVFIEPSKLVPVSREGDIGDVYIELGLGLVCPETGLKVQKALFCEIDDGIDRDCSGRQRKGRTSVLGEEQGRVGVKVGPDRQGSQNP